jgi:hypothetical protein
MLLPEEILDELKQYMITNNTHIPYISPIIKRKPIEIPVHQEKEKEKEKNTIFVPQEKDTLFWIFYVIKNGFADYEYPGNTLFVKEKEEKFKLIEYLRLNKHLLKTNKIKNVKEDIEDELANKEVIGMKTFIALCIGYKINILFIHKRKCFDLISIEGNPYHIIQHKENHRPKQKFNQKNFNPNYYSYEMDPTQEMITNYKDNYFKWDIIDKPIKGLSAYKVDELLEICKKLELSIKDGKILKKDLYEMIVLNI